MIVANLDHQDLLAYLDHLVHLVVRKERKESQENLERGASLGKMETLVLQEFPVQKEILVYPAFQEEMVKEVIKVSEDFLDLQAW